MKKVLGFLWRLPKTIFCKINECEENFLHKFNPEYKSKLALNALIYFVAYALVAFLAMPLFNYVVTPLWLKFGWNLEGNLALSLCIFLPILILTVLYLVFYLRKRLPMIEGRKWWYCIQVVLAFLFGGNVILLPIYVLVGLLVVAFYVVIALILLWIALAMIGGSSGGSKGRRKWKLDNGDEVTETKGILGESYYTGTSGTSYETNDGGDTFYEK